MAHVRTAISTTLAAIALIAAPAASATRSGSSNWAGYAVHGATFQQISAHWRQPRAACVRGKATYSAMWVGLGGFSITSNALEQIGTELDCMVGGGVASSAWYELVPSQSHTLGLRIRPGDEVSASVAFGASGVTMAIADLTSGRSFQRTLHPTTVDVTSAEWILEAPSACIQGTNFCRTLPLTDFGHATFTTARALGGTGTLGTISSGAWAHTRINLVPNGQQFATNHSGAVPFGTARPSSLSPNGGTFNVTFRRVYVPPGTGFGHRLPRGPSYLRH
jgi:Peptidase A4 family